MLTAITERVLRDPWGSIDRFLSAADVEDLASKTAVTLEEIPDAKKEEDFLCKWFVSCEHSSDS